MLAKLLALLAATKGATVAAVVVLGAATMTVGATTPEVQDAVKTVMQTLTVQTEQSDRSDCDHGQPAVVAQRNAATKLIDAAWQEDQKALESLRGKGVDNQAAAPLVKTADDQLRALRTKALNDVAALTLGREGQNKASGSPRPSKSPKPSASPCPPESAEAAETPKPAASPKAEDIAKPSQEGRVTVAERTTLDANVKAVVDKAVTDMAKVVTDVTATVGALPAADHGKSSDNPGSDHQPSDNPGASHRP
jgi:hypothetical protein